MAMERWILTKPILQTSLLPSHSRPIKFLNSYLIIPDVLTKQSIIADWNSTRLRMNMISSLELDTEWCIASTNIFYGFIDIIGYCW